MINRRQLRIKVLQALYAYFQSDNKNIITAEKQVLSDIEKMYDLFIYQLSFLVEIIEFVKFRSEENKQKFFPTKDEINPNTKFIDNKFLLQLSTNKSLIKHIELRKISWHEQNDLILKLYKKIKNSSFYIEYMNSDNNSYEADKKIVIKLLKKIILPDDILKSFYEEKNINWVYDYEIVNFMIIKTIKSYKQSWDEYTSLPSLYKLTPEGNNEYVQMVKDLFKKSILRSKEFDELINEKAKNWDLDRIAIIDVIIIKMALVEFLEFPYVPLKVSMNEYIEISKIFSSPNSKSFINGMLDKLVADLKKNNKIKKIGRGLLE